VTLCNCVEETLSCLKRDGWERKAEPMEGQTECYLFACFSAGKI